MALVRPIKDIVTLAVPYFKSSEARFAWTLLGTIIALELGQAYIGVLLNQWNRDFFNAMQAMNLPAFYEQLIVLFTLAAITIALTSSQRYMVQWLEIRWRHWMTQSFLLGWLRDSTQYRLALATGPLDNPDQRIQEDVREFIGQGLMLLIGLLGAVTSLAAFIVVLWNLSEVTPIVWGDRLIYIKGYLVWTAFGYAALGTWITHLVGRRLIALNFVQQKYEADFRFGLMRVRENAEQIALLRGESVERTRLMDRFRPVVANWHAIMRRQLRLNISVTTLGQISVVFPSLLVAPAFFAGQIHFGEQMQTSAAFVTVYGAFAFILRQYTAIASFKAVADRLTGFRAAIDAADACAQSSSLSGARTPATDDDVQIRDIRLALPDGTDLMSIESLSVRPGETVLISGATGTGKSTFFRAIGGIWPYGAGQMRLPDPSQVMLAPQSPYLPIGTLADAICFPAEAAGCARDKIESVMRDVGMHKFIGRLDETQHWDHQLSLGELQRIGFARVLLQAPRFLFLDEATSAIDEPSEAMLYALLRERMPGAAIISIGHRTSLRAFHERLLLVTDTDDGRRLVEQ